MKLLREITAGLVLWGFSSAVLSSCRLNLGAVRNTSTTILRAPTNQKAGTTRLTGIGSSLKDENPMTVAENKAVISSFLEEALNQGDGSTACMAVDGATDTEVFRAYVQEVLCPTLRTGDVVIMDNLSPHKSTQTLELIQQVGAQVLFLPPYSPDLNPVEKMWSKLKEFLRSKEARSLPTLIEAIALALERITPPDAINSHQATVLINLL
jgi:transposase